MRNISRLEHNSTQERIEGLKNMSFETFLRLILILRKKYGIGEGNDKSKHFLTTKDKQKSVSVAWLTMYLGPEQPLKELQKIFEEGQKNISEENLGDFVLQLYVGITLGQVFYEGNGRTAIILYNYLMSGEFEELLFSISENSNKRTSGEFLSPHKKVLFYLSIRGVESIFREKGMIENDEKLDPLNDSRNDNIYVKIKKDGRKLLGNEAFIVFVSLCDILEVDYKKMIHSQIEWDLDELLNTDELKNSFENIFKRYCKLAFERSLQFSKENHESVSGHIHGNIQQILGERT